jgi:hypothetical protein
MEHLLSWCRRERLHIWIIYISTITEVCQCHKGMVRGGTASVSVSLLLGSVPKPETFEVDRAIRAKHNSQAGASACELCN